MVDGVLAGTKAQYREAMLSARRAVPDATRANEAVALNDHLTGIVGRNDTVCAYLPVGAEPGSPQMVDRLRELCARVLLPVTRSSADGEPLALLWGVYVPGALVAARFGLLEPAEPWLPSSAVAEADMVLVPALAVDRAGVRLGRGGGFYDRSLVLCKPGAMLVAVVRDSEVVDELPSEPHDVRMTHVLTPHHGLFALADR
ncbi:5-formyltetrahydrofolate cyclo-ligase [Mycobacterium sp. CVI_P3]|uniref:5-formyltetrahydrofolate cyclo-ligase n=1 Tax=Mycobacterium pinniadriaticum TaxID=2994102 RepID=A0ABT3SDH5_9MYCO|nr:5-formyltetrahydrofolate cyclo-ligase [Mycobacterium pinniadriaticum]MCX2931197.1 5-formyltetrahydrofolate cyclo-ligase [Mycobacterium pinniadriaticum]MCX2937579.1 5-formyltetrahydrofolate cyclo-ligase [Mycobacterium pinniadriaticum]